MHNSQKFDIISINEISIYFLSLIFSTSIISLSDIPTAGAELKEVEQHHEREEDGGPGDVDETSDGGDRDTIPLTLHGGEDEKLHVTVRTLHHIGH